MLLPKGGINWKAASSRLPPSRAVLSSITRTRFLALVAVTGTLLLLWRAVSFSASEMER